MFFLLEIMAFECVAVTYPYYEVNSRNRELTSYQTILRSQMWLEEMFSNWILFGSNVKFVSVWESSTRWFTKGVLKREISGIQVTTTFGVNNFQNIWAMKLVFFLKMRKILFRFQKSKKRFRKCFRFWK